MSKFCEDDLIWNEYFPPCAASQDDDLLALKVLEWYEKANGMPQELSLNTSASLIARDQDQGVLCPLRIVFAPFASESVSEKAALKRLFQHYSFPSAVLSELQASISNSFGTIFVDAGAGVSVAWSHFLCKEIYVRSHGEENDANIYDPHQLRQSSYPENWSWRFSHFVVHTRQEAGKDSHITLLCFGAPEPLVERFKRLLHHANWHDAVEDPYILYDIVYGELYTFVDKLSWQLADMFRPVETATLDHAGANATADQNAIDFPDIHNISKHCTYMAESVDAAILTLEDMVAYLTRTRTASNPTITSLTYRKSTFKSIQLRLRSLEKRMANIISLSFNLVTQQDSRVMQNDSSAMKLIAVMTLIFLPATGISSVFSTPFFHIDFEGPNARMLDVAASVWIFWVVSIPLTAIIFVAWYWIYHEAKKRRGRAIVKHWGWSQRHKKRDASNVEHRRVERQDKMRHAMLRHHHHYHR